MAVRAQPALLEREAELARLDAALEEARGGAGAHLLVEGAAGIGKTRLLAEARDRAVAADMRVLTARGSELEREFPFALGRQLFEPALREAGSNERDELLSAAAAPAGPVFGFGAPADKAVPGDPSFATLNGLYWLTSNLAEAQPLLLAVDDAHWSDAASLRFFRFLVPRLDDLPVVLALAARTAEPGTDLELLGSLAADPAATVIRPHELSAAAVSELVREEVSAEAAEEFCLACHRASGGNPFLLRELLGELSAAGSSGGIEEAARVREVAPGTIQRAVLLRLARLPDAASELARAVAVLGDDADLHQAAELAQLEEAAAREAADSLADAGILEARRPLRFVHPLIRTAVSADIAATATESMHRRAAELLSGRGAAPDRVAVHLLATDPAGDAAVVEALTVAARRALDRAAPDSAASYLRRALAEPPPADARLDLVHLLVRACYRAGDREGFEELSSSGAVEELIADPRKLMESAAELALILHTRGRREDVKPMLERAIQVAAEAGEDELVVRLQGLLTFWGHLSPAAARERLDRIKDRIRPGTAEEHLYLALQAFFGLFSGVPRETVADLAKRAIEDGRIWRESLEIPEPAMLTLIVLRYLDELDAAERAHAELLAAVGQRLTWAVNSEGYDRGEVAFLRGQVAEAEASARLSVAASRQRGFGRETALWLALLVEILVERDDLAGAEAELVASGFAESLPLDYWFGPLLYSRARLRLAQGRPAEALNELVASAERSAKMELRGQWHPFFSYIALGLDAVGRHDEARAAAEYEVADARAWGLARRTGIALRALGLIEGGERGLELLRESIAVLEDSPAKLERARSLAEYGAMLRRAGRRSEAREPLREALAWARGTGALAVARRAYEELEASGERLRPLAAEGVESLTASERRVAGLAAEGHTNREIAQALFLSVKTVEMHLSHAYRKLDIESRQELGAAIDGT